MDEADIIKTDGRYIYTVSGRTLSIIRAYPYYQAEVLSTISYSSPFNPRSLFIEGDFMAVFGTTLHPTYRYVTEVKVYNIENRSSPQFIKSYQFEGWYRDGRKAKNGFIYIVSNQNLSNRPSPTPWFKLGSIETHLDIDQVFDYSDSHANPSFVNIFAFDLGKAN